jgi:hypothetical protein
VCGSVPVHAAKFPIRTAEPDGGGRHSGGMQIASPFVFLGFAAALAAQSLVVVPNGYEHLEGTSAARTPLGWSSSRIQYLVDGSQLCSQVAVIQSLRLRLDGGNFNVDAPVAKSFQATLDVYEVPVTPATMTATFANNVVGAVPTNVFQGALVVPAAARLLPYPNPWTVELVLTQPFVYSRSNGNLLLDLTLTGGSGDNWPADGFFLHATEARGEVTKIQEDLACASAAGSLSLDVPAVAGNGVVGGTLVVAHTVTPVAGAAVDFVYHVVSLDNQQSGGVPLPVSLAVLGAPSCLLNVDPQIGVLVPTAAGSVVWPLPNGPAALGLPLYAQAVAIDFVTGTFVPSRNAWQVRLGDVVPPSGPAQMVHRSNYTGQATGALSPTGYYGLVVGFVGTFQ